MKLLGISPNGKMIKLGEDTKTGNWYFVDNRLEVVIDNTNKTVKYENRLLKLEDNIVFRFEKRGGSNYIVSLFDNSLSNSSTDNIKDISDNIKETTSKDKNDKVENKRFDSKTSIAQTSSHCASRMIQALTGQLSIETIEPAYNKLFNLVLESIKKETSN